MYPIEALGFAAIRRELARRSSGRLLEIGPGTGANLSPLTVFSRGLESYTGVDPGPPPELAVRVAALADRRGIPAQVQAGYAEKLPFADNSFDTVLVTLVLCSVRSQSQAASEIRRVLASGGRLLFMEHVIHPRPGYAALMHSLDPVYNRITRECHLNRDTARALQQAGFGFRAFHRHKSGLLVWGEADA